jgi:hypothetical protein
VHAFTLHSPAILLYMHDHACIFRCMGGPGIGKLVLVLVTWVGPGRHRAHISCPVIDKICLTKARYVNPLAA